MGSRRNLGRWQPSGRWGLENVTPLRGSPCRVDCAGRGWLTVVPPQRRPGCAHALHTPLEALLKADQVYSDSNPNLPPPPHAHTRVHLHVHTRVHTHTCWSPFPSAHHSSLQGVLTCRSAHCPETRHHRLGVPSAPSSAAWAEVGGVRGRCPLPEALQAEARPQGAGWHGPI